MGPSSSLVAAPTEWSPDLEDWVLRTARETGFDLAAVSPALDAGSVDGIAEADRFAGWIDAGYAGEMAYLKRRDASGAFLRSNVQVPMPWARSVIVCALNYNAEAPRSTTPAPPGTGWIARYAWSGRRSPGGESVPTDYHDELLAMLRAIESKFTERTGCTTRCYVDTGPILERNFAARAGIGWIGKNTCVLNQQLGSWLLLGVIVTSLAVESPGRAAALLAADRCGTCTRCIDACPTEALLGSAMPDAPREMDASRCIAYLTIEKKGPIDEPLRALVGRQVFGCDICQDVCPWNRRAPIGRHEGMVGRPELIHPDLEWLAAMDSAEFKRHFKGSPVERTGLRRLLRNVALAMGNSGEARFLGRLDSWACETGDGQLRDAVLMEAANWARHAIREAHGELRPGHPSASIDT